MRRGDGLEPARGRLRPDTVEGASRLRPSNVPGRVIGPFDPADLPVVRDPLSARFHQAVATVFASRRHATPEEAGQVVHMMGMQADLLRLDREGMTRLAESLAERS